VCPFRAGDWLRALQGQLDDWAKAIFGRADPAAPWLRTAPADPSLSYVPRHASVSLISIQPRSDGLRVG